MKSIITAGLLLGAAHGMATPALAGPFVNVEANSGFSGSEYVGSVTDIHVGYDGAIGESASFYVQGGPAVVSPDGGSTTTELSGKAGLGVDVTEALNVYGEVSFITVDGSEDSSYGTKVGVKYSF
jgi:hypothetical protein